MKVRPYQEKLILDIDNAWASGAQNVLAVAATGSGKTVTFSQVVNNHTGYSCTIAHRQEIVGQISLSVARYGVSHRVIAPENVVRMIHKLHIRELGYSRIDPRSPHIVAGVQTLIKQQRAPWMDQVSLFVCDEAHHLLRSNQWGAAAALFPNAKGLLVTATPIRADGAGLGRKYDGIVDAMVLAPSMRDLIHAGYLTDYRIFAPPSDVDYSAVPVAASGDYSLPALRAAVHKSGTIVGDVVEHYRRIAGGKQGVTFAVDIEAAKLIAAAYEQQGISAAIITGKTDDLVRSATIRRFARREIRQLVSVDILGEGFDCPGIEAISMVRKTESLSLYMQQIGRALRPSEGKTHALVIDHVGNVIRHNLPDIPRDWSIGLVRRDRKAKKKVTEIPLRQCLNATCMAVFERYHKCCPHCGIMPVPASRGAPEHVDGDLSELSPEAMAALRGEIQAAEMPPRHPDRIIQASLDKKHREKMEEQAALREAIALYGGWRTSQGHGVSESQRLFFYEFGIDVGTAQTLKRVEAEALRIRVVERLTLDGVIKSE